MSGPAHSREQMIALWRRAMAAPIQDVATPNEEEIAQLATGEIPAAARDRILRAIAAHEQAAALLADVSTLGLADDTAHGAPAVARPLRLLPMAWAAAACLTLGLGVWRVADPPAPLGPSADGTIGLLHMPGDTPPKAGASDYWQQLDQQRRRGRMERDRARDRFLIGSGAVCILLAIPLLWRRAGRRRKQA